MEKELLKKRIDAASKAILADIVLKNCKVVNVYTHEIIEGDIAISDGVIVGVGSYGGIHELDCGGKFAIPGLIESHIHIESSFVTPEEFGRAVVPHGTTTAVCDPHEIVNVCGMIGLDYMVEAAKETVLDIRYMMPSCVPATPWEHNGAKIDAKKMLAGIRKEKVMGVGEFMNAPGVIGCDDGCIDKLLMAQNENVIVDGHAPGLAIDKLPGYAIAGPKTDHECTTVEEVKERLRNGMYVQLRYGSAATELTRLAPAVDEGNAHRFLLCSDDRNPETLLDHGDVDESLRVSVSVGIDPITAVQMATINAAECYHLFDRGAIAPGKRADIVLVDNLTEFNVKEVWIEGRKVAEDGKYLPEVKKHDIRFVASSVHVVPFSAKKLNLHLKSGKVHVMDMIPGSLVTKDTVMDVKIDKDGDLLFDPEADVAKISVIERHHYTRNIANALIRGYGIKTGAVAISIGHDSHNILTIGTDAKEMHFAVKELIKQKGGIVLSDKKKVLERLELPVAGLMSPLSVEEVRDELEKIYKCAHESLGVKAELEPIMALCFMSLPVIPELKLTDMGLFNVTKQEFIKVEAE